MKKLSRKEIRAILLSESRRFDTSVYDRATRRRMENDPELAAAYASAQRGYYEDEAAMSSYNPDAEFQITQDTGIEEIPAEEEDVEEMARYDALNRNPDMTLLRDNPDYRSAYNATKMDEGSKKKKEDEVEVGNQWYYGRDRDLEFRWDNFGGDYNEHGLMQYIDFDKEEEDTKK